MNRRDIGRRAFLQGAGLAALSAAGVLPVSMDAQDAAPNSTGTERAKLKAPRNSCDCHHHIYDTARFVPAQPGSESNATVADYRLLQRRTGTTRSVVVTPRPYATDNRDTVDAISQLGANARGVAVVNTTVTDAELEALAHGGIRGIRFSINANPAGAITTIDMIEPLAKRVNALGWHIDINMDADQIVAAADLWPRVASPIVFDHLGHLPLPMGVNHPAFPIMRNLIDKGQTWVKLSFGNGYSKVGPPSYADVTPVAQAFVQAAPERMVWGSNWPHPGETEKPDDALTFDLLAQWAPNAATRHRILVENPEVLYGFAKSG